ncbi:MAG TPA: DUF2269 family protein [Caulobacteraceae bacterium]
MGPDRCGVSWRASGARPARAGDGPHHRLREPAEVYLLLKYLHVLGAVTILGTGAGIAFFMLMADRTGDAAFVALAILPER